MACRRPGEALCVDGQVGFQNVRDFMVKHYEEEGYAHFLTFGTYHHFNLFSNHLSALFVDRLQLLRRKELYRLYAYVVMSNHVHLLIKPLGQSSISKILSTIKRPFSFRAIKYILENEPDKIPNPQVESKRGLETRFWQRGGGYDRNINSPQAIYKNIEYIHNNPVRAGLVEIPENYKWSSAKAWLEENGDVDSPYE